MAAAARTAAVRPTRHDVPHARPAAATRGTTRDGAENSRRPFRLLAKLMYPPAKVSHRAGTLIVATGGIPCCRPAVSLIDHPNETTTEETR
jgi:hypothetical protein